LKVEGKKEKRKKGKKKREKRMAVGVSAGQEGRQREIEILIKEIREKAEIRSGVRARRRDEKGRKRDSV
jgi:hypothetical protein